MHKLNFSGAITKNSKGVAGLTQKNRSEIYCIKKVQVGTWIKESYITKNPKV